MKIGIHLNHKVTKNLGGSYSYFDSLLIGISRYMMESEIKFVLISENKLEKDSIHGIHIESLDISSFKPKYSFFDRLLNRSTQLYKIQKNNYIKEKLSESNVDYIFYAQQHDCLIEDYPFISINWDLAHITCPNFPEVLSSFKKRDWWYKKVLPNARLILAESEAGKKELINNLSYPEEQIKVFPLFPGSLIHLKLSDKEVDVQLDKIGLSGKKFFHYPAQFWALKNHYHLLKAFKKLVSEQGEELYLVLSGSDGGNLDNIKKLILEEELNDYVILPGFISHEMLYSLYKRSLGLVMPTFLGPTNMPVIEALALACPIICTEFDGHKEIAGEYAHYINPLNVESIFTAMQHKVNHHAKEKEIALNGQRYFKTSCKFNPQKSFEDFKKIMQLLYNLHQIHYSEN